MANTSNGQFVWYELLTKDPKAAIAFYGEVAGFKTEPFGDGYTMWVGSQGPLGGVMALSEDEQKRNASPYWIGSVQVEDVDATAAQVKKLGGKVLSAPQDIPKAGRYAVVADPQGAALSLFKPEGGMQKHDVTRDGEMSWSELMTDEPAAAFDYYAKLFGWKVVQDIDMGDVGTYRVFGTGAEDRGIGGIMRTPKGAPMPPTWVYYIATSDLDAAIGRAQRRGAKVLNGPMDIPDGGRIAQLEDPQGAMFALHARGKGM